MMQYIPGKAGSCVIFGLSTENKPQASASNGFVFISADTGETFHCDGSTWNNSTEKLIASHLSKEKHKENA